MHHCFAQDVRKTPELGWTGFSSSKSCTTHNSCLRSGRPVNITEYFEIATEMVSRINDHLDVHYHSSPDSFDDCSCSSSTLAWLSYAHTTHLESWILLSLCSVLALLLRTQNHPPIVRSGRHHHEHDSSSIPVGRDYGLLRRRLGGVPTPVRRMRLD